MKKEVATRNHESSLNRKDLDALATRSTRNERVHRKKARSHPAPYCQGSRAALCAIALIGIAAYFVVSGADNKRDAATVPGGQSLRSKRPEAFRSFSWATSNPIPTGLVGLTDPYSVVPGGVHSAAELSQAVARDITVAQHYAGFQVSDAQVVSLPHRKAMYMSYRLGGRIYWTRRKLTLPKGEKIITDGVSLARVRSGNRLSKIPRSPISLREPLQRDLEGPPAPAAQTAPAIPAASGAPIERVPSEVESP